MTYEHTILAISLTWLAIPVGIVIYLRRRPVREIKRDELRRD